MASGRIAARLFRSPIMKEGAAKRKPVLNLLFMSFLEQNRQNLNKRQQNVCLPANFSHAWPSSTPRRATVFFATPVMRTVARMLVPSTRQAITRVRSLLLRRFIFCGPVKMLSGPSCQRQRLGGAHPCALAVERGADVDMPLSGHAISRRAARLACLQFWRIRILQRGHVIGCLTVDSVLD